MDNLVITTFRNLVAVSLFCVALGACGGGGSSRSAAPAAPPTPPAPTPAQPPTQAELQAASLLASQATMGATYSDIESMAELGGEAWIDSQMALAPSFNTPIVDDLVQRREAGEFEDFEEDVELFFPFAGTHGGITR